MKKTSILRKLFVMIFTFITITAFAQINSNGGFEAWTGGFPDGWKGSKTNIANASIVQATDAHTGNYACMLKTTTTHKRFTTQPMALVANQQYTITYWVKGVGKIRTCLYDDNYNTYNEYHFVNSDTYIQFVDTVKSDVTVSNGEFIFSVLDSTGNDSLTIDDVEINFYPPVDENVVATPNINVSGTMSGADYVNSVTVSINTTTSDASIYYTVDGSTPTTSSTLYSAPFPVTNSCTVKAFATKSGFTDSEIASTTISIRTVTVLFEEDFEGTGLGQMSQYSVAGDSKVWVKATYSGNSYANLNAYNAGVNEDWLMTPQLTPASSDGVTLSFRTAKNYSGNDLMLKYSTNYSGSGDPTSATWTDITDSAAWSTGSFTWTPSGDVVIAGNAPLYIAFVYTSTANQAAAWEVDDIVVTSSSAPQAQPTLTIISPADGSTYLTLDTLRINLAIENFEIGTDGLLKIESNLLSEVGMPNPTYMDATAWAVFQNMTFSPLPAGTFTATVSLVGLDSLPLTTPVTATTSFTVVAPTLATPTITVTGNEAETAGSYYFTANVAIAAENGATIHYTTDGTTPDASSTTYSAPFNVTTSCTVKAIAMKANYANSDIASAIIVIDTPTVAAPAFEPASGVFTDSVVVSISCTDTAASIRYTTDGSEPTETSTLYESPITLTATATLKAKAFKANWHASQTIEATYTIVNDAILTVTPTTLTFNSTTLTNNITVSAAYINGPIVLTCNDTHFTLSNDTLTNGNSTVTVTFNGTEPATGIITITGDTLSAQVSLTATVTLPKPTFTPASGATDTLIEVVIACANANAAIYYTTDGSTPDANATLYSTPIVLNTVGDHTIKAIAILNGWDNSEVAMATYNIYRMTVATPTILPADTSSTALTVSISCATPGATIYYTTDGTTPSNTSNIYSVPFELNAPGTYTVNAIAMRTNWNNSDMATAHYTIYQLTVETPVITPNSGFNYDPVQVSISCATSGASIYYTTDGTEPTENSNLYAAPFTVDSTSTVKAKAFKAGYIASNLASATYTFPVTVPNIAAFKAANSATNSTVYKIAGDVTFVFENGANFYIQDATGGLLIYDNQNNNIITRTYTEGDVISGGVFGTYKLYNGLVELVPTRDLAAASSNTDTVAPVLATIEDINTNYDQFESRLVKLEDVTFTQGGTFTTTSPTNIAIEQNGESMQVRNVFKTLDMTIPAEQVADVTGFVLRFNSNFQIAPRDNDDIEFVTVAMDTVETPVITVNPLTNDMVSVTITCATEGASIYYTMDETTPTENSTFYPESFVMVDMEFTVKAIAVKEGMVNSEIASFHYNPVGVREHEANVTIYPNPTVDQCHIVSDNSVIRTVAIFDLNGKLVRQMSVNDSHVEMDMSRLASGNYILRIATDNGTTVKNVVRQ